MRSRYGTKITLPSTSSRINKQYEREIEKGLVKTTAFLSRYEEKRVAIPKSSNKYSRAIYQPRQVRNSLERISLDLDTKALYSKKLEVHKKRALKLSNELNVRPKPTVRSRQFIRIDEKEEVNEERCDKCDRTDHKTDNCPIYKKPRENHPDAQKGRGKVIGGVTGDPIVIHNARMVRMPGDGNCLFHSLAYGLGRGVTARGLRKEIAGFIAKNPSLEIAETPLKDWIKWDSNTSVTAYANRMRVRGWGGGIECAAFSRLKGINVHIYEKQNRGGGFKRISCFDTGKRKIQASHIDTINIVYCGGVHYNALEI